MKDVLAWMKVVEWTAKNLHYNSDGKGFYGLHLLADKVDFGTSEDDLKEAYYLGYLQELPPTEIDICARAAEVAKGIVTTQDDMLVEILMKACENGLYVIEEAKREAGMFAGIHSIVDGISQKMLVIKGLCWRTLNAKEDKERDGADENGK